MCACYQFVIALFYCSKYFIVVSMLIIFVWLNRFKD